MVVTETQGKAICGLPKLFYGELSFSFVLIAYEGMTSERVSTTKQTALSLRTSMKPLIMNDNVK